MHKKKKTIERISAHERDRLMAQLSRFLEKGNFVNAGTCSLERMPSVAPKLVAKVEKNIIYLIDYVLGRTHHNLVENPRISVSFVDDKTFTGYQLNGTVEILEEGEEFSRLAEEFQKIKTNFTVERILMNVRTGEKATPSEFSLPEKFAIIKVKVIEIVEITSSGGLRSRLALEMP